MNIRFNLLYLIDVAAVIVCIVLGFLLLRAAWRLFVEVRRERGAPAEGELPDPMSNPGYWIQHPWRYMPTRWVLVWVALLFAFILGFYYVQAPPYSIDANGNEASQGIAEEIEATPTLPSAEEMRQRVEADTPPEMVRARLGTEHTEGLDYAPPKVDREKEIEAALKRAAERNKETK